MNVSVQAMNDMAPSHPPSHSLSSSNDDPTANSNNSNSSSNNVNDDDPTGCRPLQVEAILKPGPRDVLLGRGGGTNNHTGNVQFRKLVNQHKLRYLSVSKVEKPNVAREVVALWRKMDGRFLVRQDSADDDNNSNNNSSGRRPRSVEADAVWVEVGEKKAREKASQCLRERTPDMLPFIRQMRDQQDQMTEDGVAKIRKRQSEEDTTTAATTTTTKQDDSHQDPQEANIGTATQKKKKKNNKAPKNNHSNKAPKNNHNNNKAKKTKTPTTNDEKSNSKKNNSNANGNANGNANSSKLNRLSPHHHHHSAPSATNRQGLSSSSSSPVPHHQVSDGKATANGNNNAAAFGYFRQHSMPEHLPSTANALAVASRRGSMPTTMMHHHHHHHNSSLSMHSHHTQQQQHHHNQQQQQSQAVLAAAYARRMSAPHLSSSTGTGMSAQDRIMASSMQQHQQQLQHPFHQNPRGLYHPDALHQMHMEAAAMEAAAMQSSQHQSLYPSAAAAQLHAYQLQREQEIQRLQVMELQQQRQQQQQQRQHFQSMHMGTDSRLFQPIPSSGHSDHGDHGLENDKQRRVPMEANGYRGYSSPTGAELNRQQLMMQQQQQQQRLPNVVTPRESYSLRQQRASRTPELLHHEPYSQQQQHRPLPPPPHSLPWPMSLPKVDPPSAGALKQQTHPPISNSSQLLAHHDHHPQSSSLSQTQPEGASAGDIDNDRDEQGELTLAEYRRSLEAYIVDNNISANNSSADRVSSDPEEDDDDDFVNNNNNSNNNYHHRNNKHNSGDVDGASLGSFHGGWPDHPSPAKAQPQPHPLEQLDGSRHDDDARPDPPAFRNAPHVRRVDRHLSGHSIMSAKTHKSYTTGTLSGMSMLSDMDLEKEEEKKKRASFSSNCSIMSELTDISTTVDELALYDDA